MAFNNIPPIFQLKRNRNFNKSIPSTKLDFSLTYCNNIFDKKKETRFILNNIICVIISNVCCSFNLKTHLNLRRIALKWHDVEYRRSQMRLIMKLRKPSVTANIYSNGKIYCVGIQSEYEAKIAARRIARIIQKLGYNSVRFSDFKIMNVLGSCLLPFRIRIMPFVEKYKSFVEYEPELQSGVIYKTKELKATITVFWTGKIIVNTTSEEMVIRAIRHIYPLVSPFRRSIFIEKMLQITREQEALEVKKSNENRQI